MSPDASTKTADTDRVTYQGITHSICKYCHDRIGSDKSLTIVELMEKSHRCAAKAAAEQQTADDRPVQQR